MKTPRTKKAMIEFLSGHFRYDTMNGWNRATSYARNVKLRNIKFPDKETEDRAYDLLQTDGAHDDVNWVLDQFAEDHNWEYQIGFNGRSSGYLVLYKGGRKPSEYKRVCRSCGQKNYSAESKKCGRCGSDNMHDYSGHQTFTNPGQSIDGEQDWEDWDVSQLKDRVKLVMEFDRACEDAVQAFIGFCKDNKAEEKAVMVPHKVMMAVPA